MRVLIVCPSFAPSNAADSHRVRLLLPYLRENGCEAEVLAVDARDVRSPRDPWLSERLPNWVPVHHVRAWPLRGWGLNGLAQRAIVPLYRRGSQLLGQGRFDLVFFSTTETLLHVLGPLWQRQFGVPFCMDYQDPWVNDYYREHSEIIPPGGRIKFGLSDRLHRWGERSVAPRCSGFLAVSKGYLDSLTERYGQSVTWQPRLVQPFPGEPAELETLRAALPEASPGPDQPRLIRYIGRGGPDMDRAVRAFFKTWRDLIDRGAIAADALRFEAIGTAYYADKPQPTMAPLANEYGLRDCVSEDPRRLGYREMLLGLLGSDALVVFGSDDPAYTASKIYPYLLARRPLLAIFHRDSSVVGLMEEVGGGRCATFDAEGFPQGSIDAIGQFLLDLAAGVPAVPLDEARLARYCAPAQAAALVDWFRRVIREAKRLGTGHGS